MMYDTNLLLIGTVTSASLSKTFVEASINPGPAEIVQKYLISGLCDAGQKSVEVVSAPRIPAYPRATIKKVNSSVISYHFLYLISVFANSTKSTTIFLFS